MEIEKKSKIPYLECKTSFCNIRIRRHQLQNVVFCGHEEDQLWQISFRIRDTQMVSLHRDKQHGEIEALCL